MGEIVVSLTSTELKAQVAAQVAEVARRKREASKMKEVSSSKGQGLTL